MPVIQLSDQLYDQARQRASKAGFPTVDEYVADVVASDVSDDLANFSHIFTPEVVAKLEEIDAEMRAGGKTFTSEEVDEFLRRKSEAWREEHSR